MIIRKETFCPKILTIPDDAAIFSILNMKEKIAKKIVMENYINFCCYKDSGSGIAFFRFENSVNCEKITGLDQCIIPMDLVCKYHDKLDRMVQLLAEDYVILMPVDQKSIEFYGENAVGTHLTLIYGTDISRQTLFCKDFSGYNYVEFEVSYEAMRKSLESFSHTYLEAQIELRAFRVNNIIPAHVEYAKVFSEFYKLQQEFATHEMGYGLGAIDLYMNEIRAYPIDSMLIMSWYVLANYLREASKLIRIRYDILCKEINKRNLEEMPEGNSIVKKLLYDTNVLFYEICILRDKEIIVSESVANDLSALVYICKKDFKNVADFFCKVIVKIGIDVGGKWN